MPKPLRTAARPVVDRALRLWARQLSRRYEIHNTILVASSPRGGSTWLAELLLLQPNRPLVWEPLHLATSPSCRDFGFDWQTFVPIGAQAPDKRRYLEGLFTGRGLNLEHFSSSHFEVERFLRCEGLIVKFTRANLLLPWLLREFPLRCVFMVRHPCAVVSSQLKQGFTHLRKDNLTFADNLAEAFPHIAECHEWIENIEELLAFEWATQTYVPLVSPEPHPWHLVPYESLVVGGADRLQEVFDYLHEPMPAGASGRIRRPSRTTHQGSLEDVAQGRLTGWKNRLSADQVGRIYRVIHAMGIDFYDGDAAPDVEKLRALARRGAG